MYLRIKTFAPSWVEGFHFKKIEEINYLCKILHKNFIFIYIITDSIIIKYP